MNRLSYQEMEHTELTSLQKVAIDCGLVWSPSLLKECSRHEINQGMPD